MPTVETGATPPRSKVRVTGVRAATEEKIEKGIKKVSHFVVLDTTAGSLTGLRLDGWELLGGVMADIATHPDPRERATKILAAIAARIEDVRTAKGQATVKNLTVLAKSEL